MYSEPTVVRTLMWHHLGQNPSLFGCLNRETYNTNRQLIPFPMVSSQTLYPWPNSNQFLYFSASTSLLAWQAGISAFWVPQKERPKYLCLWRKIQSREGEIKETHMAYILNYGLLGEAVLMSSGQQVETCFGSLGESEIFIRKKLLGSTAIETVLHWLIIWSNPAKMIERSKESIQELGGWCRIHLFWTAGLRLMILCVQSMLCGSRGECWVWKQRKELDGPRFF